MEKNILKYFALIFLICISCKVERKDRSHFEIISNDVWGKRNATKDSVLYISISRETSKYLHYSVGLTNRPYEIETEMKTCFEKIDRKTIFINKCQRSSKDFKDMLEEGLISFKKGGMTAIDDSHKGYIYIFKKNDETIFKKVLSIDYFIILEDKTPQNSINVQEEEKIFDEVSEYFWTKME